VWFSLATHGTRAYTDAMEMTLDVARQALDEVRRRPDLELVLESDLTVIVFRRLGWSPEQYAAWSDHELATGHSFVVPTTWRGETVLRLCIVNPRTTIDDVRAVFDALEQPT